MTFRRAFQAAAMVARVQARVLVRTQVPLAMVVLQVLVQLLVLFFFWRVGGTERNPILVGRVLSASFFWTGEGLVALSALTLCGGWFRENVKNGCLAFYSTSPLRCGYVMRATAAAVLLVQAASFVISALLTFVAARFMNVAIEGLVPILGQLLAMAVLWDAVALAASTVVARGLVAGILVGGAIAEQLFARPSVVFSGVLGSVGAYIYPHFMFEGSIVRPLIYNQAIHVTSYEDISYLVSGGLLILMAGSSLANRLEINRGRPD